MNFQLKRDLKTQNLLWNILQEVLYQDHYQQKVKAFFLHKNNCKEK